MKKNILIIFILALMLCTIFGCAYSKIAVIEFEVKAKDAHASLPVQGIPIPIKLGTGTGNTYIYVLRSLAIFRDHIPIQGIYSITGTYSTHVKFIGVSNAQN